MTKDEALRMALNGITKVPTFTHGLMVKLADVEAAIKKALSQPEQEQEPVEYQMRTRPTWEVTSWSDWKKCSRDSAGDYAKTPKLHDWEYETRKLYTTPPKREWIGLTDEERINLSYKAEGNECVAVELTEDLLKEKNT